MFETEPVTTSGIPLSKIPGYSTSPRGGGSGYLHVTAFNADLGRGSYTVPDGMIAEFHVFTGHVPANHVLYLLWIDDAPLIEWPGPFKTIGPLFADGGQCIDVRHVGARVTIIGKLTPCQA